MFVATRQSRVGLKSNIDPRTQTSAWKHTDVTTFSPSVSDLYPNFPDMVLQMAPGVQKDQK